MRAAVLEPGGRFSVKEVPNPEPSGNQAVLRVTYCGICGSDLHAIRAGTLPAGAILGHEITGEIVALGPDARGFEVGDRVTTLSALPCDSCSECRAGRFRTCKTGWQIYGYAAIPGGYAELVLSHASVMEKVPDGLSDRVAAFNEPAIVGIHAVRDSRLRLGDTSAIIGAGPIGLLVLQAVLLANAGPVYVIEPSGGRRHVAMQLGAAAALHPTEDDVAGILQARTEIGPDVVFECAGARGTLQAALELVRPGGQVMVPGVNMEEDEVSPLTMIGKECEIRGSLGGGDLFRTALDYLAEGRIRVEPMISRLIGLEEVDSVCQTLGTAASDDVKVLVAPNQ
jgi:(R,R)-butanediol dehydrogenase/meso-butanediol dehydrogenase/diacetyl reductase